MIYYRKLILGEEPRLRGHLLRLNANERALRFLGALSDAAVAAHCARLDWSRTVVIGCFDGHGLRAAVEVHVADPKPPHLLEAAITVETGWQDRGIGTELLRRALLVTRNRGARGLQIRCFGDNGRIRHMAEKFGAHFDGAAGHTEADISTPAPSIASLCEEGFDEALGWMGRWHALGAGLLAAGPLID